jgi:hypothetical protein
MRRRRLNRCVLGSATTIGSAETLHTSEFWDVVEGCQHEREVQLATTHPVDVLFRTSRLWDDLDAGVPPLVLTHDPFR